MRQAVPALVLLLLAPAAAPAAEPGIHSYTLDNGLTVVVLEDHRAPVATQMVWYRVGAADDPPGQAGTAHFLEHLMFKATGRLAGGEFDRVVQGNGGYNNAFTSMDQTAFVERIAADRLDLVMGMEADRMVNLAPTDASVLSERDVVMEERRQTVDGSPGGAFGERLRAELYPNAPDGRPAIGSEAEIAGLTPDDAMAFYRTHYAPNNAILVVAGDVDPDAVRRMAEQHFGPIPPVMLPARPARPEEPPRQSAARIEVHDARIVVPQLTRSYLAPQRRTGDQREAAALTVLADLLGGDRITSVMASDFEGPDGIALAAQASYSNTGLNRQSFSFFLVPKPDVAPADAEAALDALIAQFVRQGPDPREVERIKGRARAQEIYMRDDVAGRATRLGRDLTSGLTLADFEAWPGIVQSLTPDDLQAAAAAVFRPEYAVTGWLMPPATPAQEPPQ